jgi:hypothetical protein
MPATVIAERIGERVRELRPLYLPVDPVSRTVYQPGELAQCDLWFPAVDVPLGYGQSGRPPVLVIVSGYSRVITARMLPSGQTGDLIDGHWRLLADGWGAVPKSSPVGLGVPLSRVLVASLRRGASRGVMGQAGRSRGGPAAGESLSGAWRGSR